MRKLMQTLLSIKHHYWDRNYAHRRCPLRLEVLEDRFVPSTCLTWQPQAGSTDWFLPTNWIVSATGAVATAAPTSVDNVIFDGTAANACDVSGTQGANCARLFNLGAFKYKLQIDGTLTIWGVNPNTGGYVTGDSFWYGGTGSVVQTGTNSDVTLRGGKMTLGGNWNDNVQGVEAPFNLYSGAYLTITGNASDMGDDLYIGYDASHTTAYAGTVEITQLSGNLKMYHNSGIAISSQGTLKLTGDGGAGGGNTQNGIVPSAPSTAFINNSGTILRDGPKLGIVTCGLYIRNGQGMGGTLQVTATSQFQVTGKDPVNNTNIYTNSGSVSLGDQAVLDVSSWGYRQLFGGLSTLAPATGIGLVTIKGNVFIDNGTVGMCTDNVNAYGQIYVTGDLTLNRTVTVTLYLDGSGAACDNFKVDGKANLDPTNQGGVTFNVKVNNATPTKNSDYAFLTANGGITGNTGGVKFNYGGFPSNFLPTLKPAKPATPTSFDLVQQT